MNNKALEESERAVGCCFILVLFLIGCLFSFIVNSRTIIAISIVSIILLLAIGLLVFNIYEWKADRRKVIIEDIQFKFPNAFDYKTSGLVENDIIKIINKTSKEEWSRLENEIKQEFILLTTKYPNGYKRFKQNNFLANQWCTIKNESVIIKYELESNK